jgi:surface antigen
VPNGKIAPVVSYGFYSSSIGFAAVYGGNGYDYGWCTYYAASRVAVPNNWGNASTWDDYARLSGWTVSSRPVAGAVAQTDYAAGGLGHVAYVEAVSDDGTMMKYSDMNGLAGWGRVGYSGWVPISTFPHYIYH